MVSFAQYTILYHPQHSYSFPPAQQSLPCIPWLYHFSQSNIAPTFQQNHVLSNGFRDEENKDENIFSLKIAMVDFKIFPRDSFQYESCY